MISLYFFPLPIITSLHWPLIYSLTIYSLSPSDLDGFGISNIIKDSIQSVEERCNIYSIIGASVLRYGSQIPNAPTSSMKEGKSSRPSTSSNRKKNSPRTRAQTAVGSNTQQYNVGIAQQFNVFITLF